MKIKIKTQSKLAIKDLSSGDIYYYVGKPDEAFMLLSGNCLSERRDSRYCVNLSNGEVEEPGTACEVRKLYAPEITATEIGI